MSVPVALNTANKLSELQSQVKRYQKELISLRSTRYSFENIIGESQQIEALIKSIQGEINEAGTSMEENIQRVVEGSNLANNAHNKLQEIETVSTQLAELVRSITVAATQQAKASDGITKTMEQVGRVSAKNSAASQQTALAIKRLSETSEQLATSVEAFKLEDAENQQPEQSVEV